MIRVTVSYKTFEPKVFNCVIFPQVVGDFIVMVTKGNYADWQECHYERQDLIERIYQERIND